MCAGTIQLRSLARVVHFLKVISASIHALFLLSLSVSLLSGKENETELSAKEALQARNQSNNHPFLPLLKHIFSSVFGCCRPLSEVYVCWYAFIDGRSEKRLTNSKQKQRTTRRRVFGLGSILDIVDIEFETVRPIECEQFQFDNKGFTRSLRSVRIYL